MKRRSLILPGFRRAFGQTPTGFQNMCTENAPPPRGPPCRNPRGRSRVLSLSSGFSLRSPGWNGRRDKARHKGKLSSTTRHGKQGRRPWRCNARAARKERKVYFSDGSSSPRDLCTLSPADAGFPSDFVAGQRAGLAPITETPFLPAGSMSRRRAPLWEINFSNNRSML